MLVTLSGMVIAVRPVQLSKAPPAILVTLSGMVTLPVQVVPSIKVPLMITSGFSSCLAISHGVFVKTNPSIFVTPFGMVTSVKLVQL